MDMQEIQMMIISLLKSGINEYEIADKIHVSQPTVSRWLSGRIKSVKANNYIALSSLYKSTRSFQEI